MLATRDATAEDTRKRGDFAVAVQQARVSPRTLRVSAQILRRNRLILAVLMQ
jgi:hypothetical protein